jgi:N-acetylglucosaminyl-diphospho-decaprenol L-rhamnosyltransferase
MSCLSIIIVNYKSVGYLADCLESIREHPLTVATEVIVIDNASFDGSADLVRQRFSDVIFIQSEQNLGFSGANNQAFARSSGDFILFLNPDTKLRDNALAKMIAALESDPAIGAVGGRLLECDLSLQIRAVLPFPSILNQVLDIDWLKKRTPRWSLWKMAPMFDRLPYPVDVEALCGACLMVRREVFESIGLFSKEYFMYAEDVDLCAKIRSSGRRVCYCDAAEILHYGGGSSTRAGESFHFHRLLAESNALLMAKFKGELYAQAYRKALGVAAIIRLMLLGGAAPLMILSGNGDRLRFVIGKWRTLFVWAWGRRLGNTSPVSASSISPVDGATKHKDDCSSDRGQGVTL